MATADIAVEYTDRYGLIVVPPNLGEDAEIAWLEDFYFEQNGRVRWYCTADGETVYTTAGSHGQMMRCPRGHAWRHTVQEYDNGGQAGIGHGWAQIA